MCEVLSGRMAVWVLLFCVASTSFAAGSISSREEQKYNDVVFQACMQRQRTDAIYYKIRPDAGVHLCHCVAGTVTANLVRSRRFQDAISRQDNAEARRAIDVVTSADALLTVFETCVEGAGGWGNVLKPEYR